MSDQTNIKTMQPYNHSHCNDGHVLATLPPHSLSKRFRILLESLGFFIEMLGLVLHVIQWVASFDDLVNVVLHHSFTLINLVLNRFKLAIVAVVSHPCGLLCWLVGIFSSCL
eukprot:TRINITY_DN9160_c0_g2_i2.p1 TRINITY_DN9160_c0_g2~~TRINITY_DN9160_c0_g2_i2.p1  ORF type:complete len:112 (+),score=17.09 TRINITY_DN9160_c0_g2_i2:96-431(+)